MAYDEELAERVRATVANISKVEEKKMFGGIAFMVNGKMCVTVGEKRIMVRIDPDMHDELIKNKGTETMVMKGRSYIGYIRVREDAIKTKKELNHWVELALAFNKKAKSSKKKAAK